MAPFVAPAVLFMLAFFIAPLAVVAHASFSGDSGFTLAHYAELISRPLYYRVLATTLEISVFATLLALVIGYPIAYHLAGQKPRRRAVLIVFVLLPFWTSILVKSFAFAVILGANGVVNS